MSKKTILYVIIGAIVLIIGFNYFYLTKSNEGFTNQMTNVDKSNFNKEINSTVVIPEISGPSDWRTYWSDEWGVGFKYPQNWVLEERRVNENWNKWDKSCGGDCGKLSRICMAGDGYQLCIDKKGRGMGSPYNYMSTIDGYVARTWESPKEAGGLNLTLGVIDAEIIIYINTPDKTKKISDEILSTIKFRK